MSRSTSLIYLRALIFFWLHVENGFNPIGDYKMGVNGSLIILNSLEYQSGSAGVGRGSTTFAQTGGRTCCFLFAGKSWNMNTFYCHLLKDIERIGTFEWNLKMIEQKSKYQFGIFDSLNIGWLGGTPFRILAIWLVIINWRRVVFEFYFFAVFFVWHTMEVYNGRWSFVYIVYIHSAYNFINLLGYEEH